MVKRLEFQNVSKWCLISLFALILISCGGDSGSSDADPNQDNHPPVLAAIGDKSVTEGERLVFSVSADDSDNDPLSFFAAPLPGGAKFDDQEFSWQPAAGEAGSYPVTFEVRDGGTPPLSDSKTITIRVEPPVQINHPPVLAAIDDKIAIEEKRLVFSVSAEDPDNDPLTFFAAPLPDGALFENQEFSWQPAAGEAGSYPVTFEVRDDGNPPLSDLKTITIRVESSPGNPDPPEMIYGETGPYTLEEVVFVNSAWPDGWPVSVLLPAERTAPVPVLFFSHGYGGVDWHGYEKLLVHLVSWGFAVVYPPYPLMTENMSERYQVLWNGFKEAIVNYGWTFNLRKVGFLGHSMGGGATPAMAWKGLVEEGWGDQGAFIFIMAPWYSYEISDAQLGAFPGHLNLVMQVYDQDDICDHRMAIDIFDHISVPVSRKSYCNVPNGSHFVPTELEGSDLGRSAVDGLLDALIDYSFEIDRPSEGKAIAIDGHGPQSDYTIIKHPTPVADESYYASPWSSPLNPRCQ